jgi:hypothetical protein
MNANIRLFYAGIITLLFLSLAAFCQVNLALIPQSSPVVIPDQGGSFAFTVTVTNSSSVTQQFSAWCNVTLPNGSTWGPTIESYPSGGGGFTCSESIQNQ